MKKAVLVTGGTRGLGKEIVYLFAKNNYDIILNYLNSDNLANEIRDDLESKYNVNICLYKCDVSDENKVKNMFMDIKSKNIKIDTIINNVGIANDSELLSKSKEDFMKVYETNLIGPFLIAKYGHKLMHKNGSIINISSTNGIDTYYTYSADYDASKAALNNLTHNLALELAPIRVNAIAAGWMNTDMNKELDNEFKDKECEKILLNRFAEPVEIAKVAYFLASDDASYINNSIIRVDGGKND